MKKQKIHHVLGKVDIAKHMTAMLKFNTRIQVYWYPDSRSRIYSSTKMMYQLGVQ
jgi:hypothetical protein